MVANIELGLTSVREVMLLVEHNIGARTSSVEVLELDADAFARTEEARRSNSELKKGINLNGKNSVIYLYKTNDRNTDQDPERQI